MTKETFREALPAYDTCEHDEIYEAHGDKRVVKKYESFYFPFPKTTHKNVFFWWLLEDGTAIGLNENPNTGVSFPVVGHRGVRIFYSSNRDAKRPKEIQL